MIDDSLMMDDFIEDMERLNPSIAGDYLEALNFAMETVSRVEVDRINRAEAVYFGTIGDGVFYADAEPENSRWFRDTTLAEAVNILAMDLGEEVAMELNERVLG